MRNIKTLEEEIRIRAEADLLFFIKLVAPHRVLGAIHEELIQWWTREDASDHQLVLLPRDHQKSAMMAYRVAWAITREPDKTFLYISSTSNLAEKQLKAIKDILTSKQYRKYWPEMVNQDEGKRERWTTGEISVDHPLRKEEGVRDPTVFAAGLTTSITGLHFDVAVLDDVVVKENAYTEEGRARTREQYSLLASIEKAQGCEWAVGTRYHPRDMYQDLIEMTEETYSPETGELLGESNVYEVFQREVENIGDGTGEYLWPKQMRPDGKWFGFDQAILSKKKAKYIDRTQFRAQYYNNPNDPDNAHISTSCFHYFDKKFINLENGSWWYKDKKLNVYAAIDFAFSLKKKADFSAIVVIGVDHENTIYVLDIARFKTEKISEYFEKILHLHTKWGFRKIRAEITVAQKAIVKELKDVYIKQYGLSLAVDEYNPSRHEGSKEERINAILEPRYSNGYIWHYKGGLCQVLEEELVYAKPPHDDVKDALAAAVDVAVAPKSRLTRTKRRDNIVYDSRFGGVAYR